MECVIFALQKRAKFNSVGQHIEIMKYTTQWQGAGSSSTTTLSWMQNDYEHKNRESSELTKIMAKQRMKVHTFMDFSSLLPVHRQSLIFPARTSESSQFQSSECSLNNATTFPSERNESEADGGQQHTAHNSASSKNYTILQIEKHSSSSRRNFILFDKWLIIITANFDSYGKTVDLLVASSHFLPIRVSTSTFIRQSGRKCTLTILFVCLDHLSFGRLTNTWEILIQSTNFRRKEKKKKLHFSRRSAASFAGHNSKVLVLTSSSCNHISEVRNQLFALIIFDFTERDVYK